MVLRTYAPLTLHGVSFICSPSVGLGEDEASGSSKKKKKRRERKKPLAELDSGQVLRQQSLQVIYRDYSQTNITLFFY